MLVSVKIVSRLVLIVVGVLCGLQLARAQDAINAPAQKQIGSTKTEVVPSLIVMNARGATLQGDTLTLTVFRQTLLCSPIAQ